ncbi:hypothetical protein [Metamycoplasma equirhinis]|uniref:hypothetical protein n=1 Tax=Metamycoplasma equirhinis TaxID=92402 RepID=UPI00359442C2
MNTILVIVERELTCEVYFSWTFKCCEYITIDVPGGTAPVITNTEPTFAESSLLLTKGITRHKINIGIKID